MLPAEIIRRVKEIQVRTGRQVADVLAGEYVSVFRGAGIEFDEVRPYIPGDDVRTIDWNVTARAGEPYVKRYVEERQLTLMIMADISASQGFGSTTRSKREAAAELCALLAFSATRNDDKVGLVLFHGEVEQYIPPRKGYRHALRVVREVLAHGETVEANDPAQNVGPHASPAKQPVRMATRIARRLRLRLLRTGGHARLRDASQSTSIARALRFFLGVSKRRSVCFVVSDFLDDDFEQALSSANRRHDVIAVLVSDPRELVFPDVGMIALRDAENGQSRLYDTASGEFRSVLEHTSRERIQQLERRLARQGIDFIHIDASQPIVEPLVQFFRMRERRQRR
jgi:uncharacterized protein (DUF58 family)